MANHIPLRWATALLAIAVCMCSGGVVQAAYPDKPVHLIVGFAPGGGTDLLARLLANKLSQKWGQPVVVENKIGADGSIAADVVSHMPPDGYNLVFITNGHTITPNEFKVNYDPIKSFSPVTQVAMTPEILVVNPTLPVKSVKELIAYARANPGKLNYGTSGGLGTSPYLETILLMKMTGIKMVNVSYKGSAPAMVGLLGNDIQLTFTSLATAMGPIQAGQVRALAVSSATRVPQLPDLPPVAEAADLPGFDGASWYGVLAPPATPTEIVSKIHDDIAEALKTPDMVKQMNEHAFIPIANTPDQFIKIMSDELVRWAALLKEVKESGEKEK